MSLDTHEEWKPIGRTNNRYSVSDKGHIRNNETGIILKPVNAKKGYVKVNLNYGGKKHTHLIHRLVATEFIQNPENKPQVNHKNGIKNDNRVDNLEWVTGEENMHHAYETGLQRHKDERYSGYLYSLWLRFHKETEYTEWRRYLTFYQWCLDNGYEKGLYIALIDQAKSYSPNNCYIANNIVKTPKRRCLRVKYYINGQEMTYAEISKEFGISEQLFKYRINSGMTAEEAAITPYRKSGRPRKEVSA